MNELNYSAGLMSQSFWFVELKRMIQLRSQGKTNEEIKTACLEENLLGLSKESRAQRAFGYLINRLSTMDDILCQLYLSSSLQTQKMITLVAILRTDRLFYEFLYEVYREKILMGSETVETQDANIFFHKKEVQAPEIGEWKDTTRAKLARLYINYMTEAGMLSQQKRVHTITPPIPDIALERYLKANGETTMLKAITGAN